MISRTFSRPPAALAAAAIALFSAFPSSSQTATQAAARQLVTAEDKGHCQACHQFPNDPAIKTRATVGPALAGMRLRFPDRARLAAIVRDARSANTETVMPPYGPHRILTENEISMIVDYLFSQ